MSSSNLRAGGDMAIRATGGNVTVIGSQLLTRRDMDVSATGYIVMRFETRGSAAAKT